MTTAPSCIDNSWSSIIYTRWSSQHEGLGCHAPMVAPFCCCQCGVYMFTGPFSRLELWLCKCICQQLRTILYGDIKLCQMCEIQFAWNLNPTWHNRWGMHISLNRPRLKSCHAVFDEKIALALRPVAGQRGCPVDMHVVRSRVTKILGGNEFMDPIMLFVRHLTAKKTLKTARCNIIIIASLWNSTDISTALP